MTDNMKTTETPLLINGEKLEDMTTKELLKFAYTEPKLEEPIGMCGSKCEGECDTCHEKKEQLDRHFSEEEQAFELYCCETCKSELSYWEDTKGIHYYCDLCLSRVEDDRYNDGYEDTGLDWNESGYFD